MSLYAQCRVCGGIFRADASQSGVQCRYCREAIAKLGNAYLELAEALRAGQPREDITLAYHFQVIEKLWSAEGKGEQFYDIIQPKGVRYDDFAHLVTAVVIKGVNEGWIELNLPSVDILRRPADMGEDKNYIRLEYRDSDRWVEEVCQLFPDVDWDESIKMPSAEGRAAR